MARALFDAGHEVLVLDRRKHVGGTAYDYLDDYGIRVSSHGAHLFHTNAPHVAWFLRRFCEWVPYEHKVLAQIGVNGLPKRVPMPINRTTVNYLFDLDMQTDEEVADWFAQHRVHADEMNAKTQVTSKVGPELFDLLYKGYTWKQWGRPAEQLSSYVTGRLPFRTNDDDRYFTDSFQAQPKDGWTDLFERMLEPIEVELGVDFLLSGTARSLSTQWDRVIFTGPIDEFFNYDLGPLPWRSVRFEHRTVMSPSLILPVGVINYVGFDKPYTRQIEWRHITRQDSDVTSLSFEFSEEKGEPHYPIPCRESWDLHAAYKKLAREQVPNVIFAGRLGSYRYMTMDQTVAQALKIARSLEKPGAHSVVD
jgi:UDP-galactopyranose mutase